jgi:hypothetical protein
MSLHFSSLPTTLLSYPSYLIPLFLLLLSLFTYLPLYCFPSSTILPSINRSTIILHLLSLPYHPAKHFIITSLYYRSTVPPPYYLYLGYTSPLLSLSLFFVSLSYIPLSITPPLFYFLSIINSSFSFLLPPAPLLSLPPSRATQAM